MSKIFIIQPYRMLQHAFSAALFPEHQIQLTETIPEADTIKGADVVIVDATALREHDSLHPRGLLAVQNWKIPTIWIDSAAPSQAPAREKLLSINQALTKEALQKALAECLGSSVAAKLSPNPTPSSISASVNANSKDQSSQDLDADKQVIELVDVVEEGSARGKSQGRRKN